MKKKTATELSGIIIAALGIFTFITGWRALPEIIGSLRSLTATRPGQSTSRDDEANLATNTQRHARVETSARYEQKRTRYLNPETWIFQRVIVLLREYNGVRAVFDRYKVTLKEGDGSIWVEREFELPKAIMLGPKSAAEASFFVDKAILDLWNANNNEPDDRRARVSEMAIGIIGEDEFGHKIVVEVEGNN